MNRDLMLAVLSMDAYNQGYNAGLTNVGSYIGFAHVIDVTTRADAEAVSASFAAVAYDWNGETVISFRGTDDTFFDAWNGYGAFFGNSSTQSELAARFYDQIVGGVDPVLIDGDIYGTSHNVVLTRHSLGGGLAGFLASLYGQEAVVFDNMRFSTAVTTVYNDATNPLGIGGFHELRLQSSTVTMIRIVPVT
jgi:Protein of unknown function (DUF2974)